MSALGWKTKVELRRSEIAQILDALADARDSFGEEATALEDRLSDILHRGDRQVAQREEGT